MFDLQTAVAESFGYQRDRRRPHARASEALMQRYYWAAKAVTQLNQILMLNIEERAQRPGATRRCGRSTSASSSTAGMLEVASDDLYRARPARDPRDLPACYQHDGRASKGLSARTLRALYNARDLMDASFRSDPVNRATFMRDPDGSRAAMTHALRLMNQTQRARPLPVGVPPHRRPDAARPVPRLHGRPAHPDGAAQRAPLLHPRARARVPVLLAARGAASTGPGCCTSRRCSTTSPRAAAATTPSSARARRGASAATTASTGEDTRAGRVPGRAST